MHGRVDREFRHPSEALALQYLEAREHTLLRHNYHLRFVEIDLITVTRDACVRFTEVKSWRDASMLHPLETMTGKRRSDLRRAAGTFLHELSRDRQTLALLRKGVRDEEHCFDPDSATVSFDLLWLRAADDVEYFENLF